MTFFKKSLFIFLFIASFFISSCEKYHTQYESEIISKRTLKDIEFKDSDKQSPLSEDEKADFSGLKYFDVDSLFCLTATFHKLNFPIPITMATSTGEPRDGLKIGEALFTINETHLSLPMFTLKTRKGEIDSLYYFIPFTDQTSGKESYPQGRYLDIRGPLTNNETFILDFNLAYNPYCNYSNKYSCPIPPKDSHLEYAITAGEKNYH